MSRRSISAFTKLDVMVVVATIVMLTIWAFYGNAGRVPRLRAKRINCVSNLKQVGLGFRMWSNDHGERFPWQVPASEGGTKEFAHLPYAALHYVVASNELNTPKILKCPEDTGRTRTNTFDAPLHLSLSYFASLSADETKPSTILAGDRNLSTNSSMLVGLLVVQDTTQLQWTKDMHQNQGNVGFADGSVAQSTTFTLRKSFNAALTNQPVRLVIP